MITGKRDVLFVGLDTATYERLTQSLSLAAFRTDYISTAPGALELISLLPYDAMVVAFPPPGMPTERFLDWIRKEDSTCRHSALVFLAADGVMPDAEAFLGQGANRVLPLDAPAGVLGEVLPGLIDVAPRVGLRALTRLEVPSDLGLSKVLCQTVNVSASGMLIRIDEDYPIGTVVDFELSVPGEQAPIRGRAEVVRHTVRRKEQLRGVGLRFRSFRGDDGHRFAGHLSQIAV
ncbi:MAG: PilZ domain-containing protein [Acidobacteriota bacterium]